MANLKAKRAENGKYGFVDETGKWVIEPKLLKAFVWNELGVVHFEEQDEDGDPYDGWAIFKLDNPSEYNQRSDETGMGGDYGWYDHLETPLADAEYIDAWNDCGYGVRIYPDGEIHDDDEFKDDDVEFEDDEDDDDWDDDDEDEDEDDDEDEE